MQKPAHMTMWLRQVARSAMFAAVLAALAPCTLAQDETPHEPKPATGQLKVVGEHIKEFLLVRTDKDFTQTFAQEELVDPVTLPAGTYSFGVTLKGEYKCIERNNHIEISADEVTELKIGAPLTQTIDVKRRGQLIALQYELKGIGGEPYAFANESAPPEFVVYRGDTEITRGRFEFG